MCVQNAFSLVDRSDSAVLDRCHEAGVAYVPYFPLGSAFPGMPKVTENDVVLEIAGRIGASPAQVGLAWLLAHRDNVLLIPGTSSVAHLEENLQAGEITLSADDVAALDKVRRTSADRAQHGVRRLDLLVDDARAARRRAGTPTSSR